MLVSQLLRMAFLQWNSFMVASARLKLTASSFYDTSGELRQEIQSAQFCIQLFEMIYISQTSDKAGWFRFSDFDRTLHIAGAGSLLISTLPFGFILVPTLMKARPVYPIL